MEMEEKTLKTPEQLAEEIMKAFGIALGEARADWAERLIEEAKLEQMLKEAEEAKEAEGSLSLEQLKEEMEG